MRRSFDDALLALREQVRDWANRRDARDVKVLVYPPEWEARMLAELPHFAEQCGQSGWPIALVDAGLVFLREIERRTGLIDREQKVEQTNGKLLLRDLGELAARALRMALTATPDGVVVCRLVLNTSALATFFSYSALANDLHGNVPLPAAIAFPGEGDDRSLSLLYLRHDTSYRLPRI